MKKGDHFVKMDHFGIILKIIGTILEGMLMEKA
jgi:hypothetical protein